MFAPMTIVALVCLVIATALIAGYLVVRPPLVRTTRVWLLFALGVFPTGVAFAGNLQGFEATKERTFCGSCHVMAEHASDSDDRTSHSLASRHARNDLFGSENCYDCHADYGMFGTVKTKLGGMGHVWKYYGEGYRSMSLAEAKRTIRLVHPYPNSNCMHCHSTEGDLFRKVPDHASSLAELRQDKVSCASPGCHGYAHPFTKPTVSANGATPTPKEEP